MALQVSSKAALVTGGGSGICLEFTKLLLSKGCNVLIADLNLTPGAQEIVSSSEKTEVGDTKKARAVFKKADVLDWSQLQAAFDKCISQFGTLDIVCPGAGVFEPVGLPAAPGSLFISPILFSPSSEPKANPKSALVQFLAPPKHNRHNRHQLLQNPRTKPHPSHPSNPFSNRLLQASKPRPWSRNHDLLGSSSNHRFPGPNLRCQ